MLTILCTGVRNDEARMATPHVACILYEIPIDQITARSPPDQFGKCLELDAEGP